MNHSFIRRSISILAVVIITLPFVLQAITLSELVNLFVSLGIIPQEKAALALQLVNEQSTTPAPVSTTPPPSQPQCLSLTRNLYLGLNDAATGSEVSKLQQYLTSTGDYTYGEITGYYGPATEAAVKKWQARNAVVSSGSPETTGYGVVGLLTRAAMKASCIIDDPLTVHGSLSASPSVGIMPLTVTFTATTNSSWIAGVKIDYGDGTSDTICAPGSLSCSPKTHTYSGSGTYRARLIGMKVNSDTVLASIAVTVSSATIDQSSLSTSSSHPVITGSASGVSQIGLSISKNGSKFDGTSIFSVVNGRWSVTLNNQTYTPGTYGVDVYDSSNRLLVTKTLTVTATSPVSLVTVYKDCNYAGTSAQYGVGSYRLADITARGGNNDDASAIRVPAGYTVKMYKDDNFSNTSVTLTGDNSCFTNIGGVNFNDMLSSMVITATLSATFSATPTSGTAPLTVTFSGVSGAINYGDGVQGSVSDAPSGGATLSHTYTAAGTYTATNNGRSVPINVTGAPTPIPAGTVTSVDRTLYSDRTTLRWSGQSAHKTIAAGTTIVIGGVEYSQTFSTTVGNIYLPVEAAVSVGDAVSFPKQVAPPVVVVPPVQPTIVSSVQPMKRSDTPFSVRGLSAITRDTWLSVAKGFNANRVVWVYTDGTKILPEAAAAGLSTQCTLTYWVPKSDPHASDMACAAYAIGGGTATLPKITNQYWKEYALQSVKTQIDNGCRMFQQDFGGASEGVDYGCVTKSEVIAYNQWLHGEARAYAAQVDPGTQLAFTTNGGERHNYIMPYFDGIMYEVYADRNTIVSELIQRAHHAESIFPNTVGVATIAHADVWLNQHAIPSAYALGQTVIAPWDVFTGRSTPRLFGNPVDFASTYAMVRKNPALFDDYVSQGDAYGSYSTAVPVKARATATTAQADGTISKVDRTTYPDRTTISWSNQANRKIIDRGEQVRIGGRLYTTTIGTTVGNIYLPAGTPAEIGESVDFVLERGTISKVDRTTYPERTTISWSDQANHKDVGIGQRIRIGSVEYATIVDSNVGNIYLSAGTPAAVGDAITFVTAATPTTVVSEPNATDVLVTVRKNKNNSSMKAVHAVNWGSQSHLALKLRQSDFPIPPNRIVTPENPTPRPISYTVEGEYYRYDLGTVNIWAVVFPSNGTAAADDAVSQTAAVSSAPSPIVPWLASIWESVFTGIFGR